MNTACCRTKKDYYINCGLYDGNGNLLKPYRKPESRMSGVTVIAEPEGMDKLATLQTVSGTGSEDTLAKIAAEWEYDGGWQLKDRELYTQIVLKTKISAAISYSATACFTSSRL